MAKLLSFKETSPLKQFTFFAQFEDNRSLSNLLAKAAGELVDAPLSDTIGQARFTHPDAKKHFKFSVHFRIAADDVIDMALFMANALSNRVDEFLKSSKVVVTGAEEESFSSFKHAPVVSPADLEFLKGTPAPLKMTIPVIIEKTLICSHCDQPVAEGKVSKAFTKRDEMMTLTSIISMGSQISEMSRMKFTPERHVQMRELAGKIVSLGGGFTKEGRILRDMKPQKANHLLPEATRIQLEEQWAADMHQDVDAFMKTLEVKK